MATRMRINEQNTSEYKFYKKRAAEQRKQWNGQGKKPRKTRADKGRKRYTYLT